VSQLLRASAAGAQVVDALLRVLEVDRGDVTPATPTKLTATSVLKPDAVSGETGGVRRGSAGDTAPTRMPVDVDTPPPLREEKTIKKPMPRKKEGE
jgi:hypothetical protein